jgi:putative membrane protein
MVKWVNIFKGFLMGICELIPGVSSGTMALLLGIYDQFLGAISKIVSKHYRKAILFLLPLVVGMGIAILTLSNLIDYLLRNHMVPTHWFFIGLVIGVVPMMLRISNYRVEFRAGHYIILLMAVALLFVMGMSRGEEQVINDVAITFPLLIKMFFSGILASTTMLLPGISGSLVLLILGSYSIVIYAVSELTSFNLDILPILIAVGSGIVLGLLVASRIIQYMLRHFTYLTYALILGLVIGSVFAIYPGLPETALSWTVTVLAAILGFAISWYMGADNEGTI